MECPPYQLKTIKKTVKMIEEGKFKGILVTFKYFNRPRRLKKKKIDGEVNIFLLGDENLGEEDILNLVTVLLGDKWKKIMEILETKTIPSFKIHTPHYIG